MDLYEIRRSMRKIEDVLRERQGSAVLVRDNGREALENVLMELNVRLESRFRLEAYGEGYAACLAEAAAREAKAITPRDGGGA
jgi:hypothetical protein